MREDQAERLIIAAQDIVSELNLIANNVSTFNNANALDAMAKSLEKIAYANVGLQAILEAAEKHHDDKAA